MSIQRIQKEDTIHATILDAVQLVTTGTHNGGPVIGYETKELKAVLVQLSKGGNRADQSIKTTKPQWGFVYVNSLTHREPAFVRRTAAESIRMAMGNLNEVAIYHNGIEELLFGEYGIRQKNVMLQERLNPYYRVTKTVKSRGGHVAIPGEILERHPTDQYAHLGLQIGGKCFLPEDVEGKVESVSTSDLIWTMAAAMGMGKPLTREDAAPQRRAFSFPLPYIKGETLSAFVTQDPYQLIARQGTPSVGTRSKLENIPEGDWSVVGIERDSPADVLITIERD